jgi:positive regulator of sigma E activity
VSGGWEAVPRPESGRERPRPGQSPLRETGTVVSVSAGRATVRLPRTTRCSGCKACVLASAGAFVLSEAENSVGARPGDEVVIEGSTPGQVRSGLILLIVPLFLFVGGFLGASAVSSWLDGSAPQGVGVAGGVGLIAAYYGALALIHRRRKSRRPLAMCVVRVLRRGNGTRPATIEAKVDEA